MQETQDNRAGVRIGFRPNLAEAVEQFVQCAPGVLGKQGAVPGQPDAAALTLEQRYPDCLGQPRDRA
ncbi:MAG: hypothetical protein JWN95_1538 [Frankiales bacterium]|nr:hypothetical protein [Frankiales bacterium]